MFVVGTYSSKSLAKSFTWGGPCRAGPPARLAAKLAGPGGPGARARPDSVCWIRNDSSGVFCIKKYRSLDFLEFRVSVAQF